MDLTQYRQSDLEQKRTEDLVRYMSNGGASALDIGARDGYFSKLLAKYFDMVTALDLEKPVIDHNKVICTKGDVTNLEYADNSFEFVFCAEVLEHIPSHLLQKACAELSRVSEKYLLIGVPYKQDIRVGRTTCYTCGGKNPQWGHVNSFNKQTLEKLFQGFEVKELSFVGETNENTNFISTLIMDLAGNPYGTYSQQEPCIHCGKALIKPPKRNILQKIFTRLALYITGLQKPFQKSHPNWIHVLFKKRST